MGNSSSSCSNENENTISLPNWDVNDLDLLISYIENRLEEIGKETKEAHTSVAESSSTGRRKYLIQFGNDFLKNILTKVNKKACKMSFKSKLHTETRKVVFGVLSQAAQMNWVGVGLCVVGYVLDQVDKVSDNKEQCIQLLKDMSGLAKHVKELVGRMHRGKLNEVVVYIVRGSLLCLSQMQSNNLYGFFSASVNGSDLERLRSDLGTKYQDLTLDAVINILKNIRTAPHPSQGKNPDAVGLDERRDKVIELLDMTEKSARAVVIYGLGGIGKTTLAEAVYNRLPLTRNGYKICRVDMVLNCSEQDLQRHQEQILLDLFDEMIEVRSCHEGQGQLSKYFKKAATQRVFLFIDNVSRASDLEKLLPPDLLILPEYSRILLTTRDLKDTHMLKESSIQYCDYSVEPLSPQNTKMFFCKKALCSLDAFSQKGVHIDELLRMCRGIPLVIEFAASEVRRHGNNISACNLTIQFLKDTLHKGSGVLIDKVVGKVYDNLIEEVYKEAFLDITTCFYNTKRRKASYIVGETELKALEDAALVKTDKLCRLAVHDIVRAYGKNLSESNRITDLQSLKDALDDKQKLETLKGIYLKSETSSFQLQAQDLDKMHKSLRFLILGKHMKISGACKRTFEELRYIKGNFKSLPIDLTKFPRLAMFDDIIFRDVTLQELPASLRKARFTNLDESRAALESVGSSQYCLEELEIENSSKLTKLPESLGELNALQDLKLSECEGLTTLPEELGNLRSLKVLHVSGCGLESLPDKMGQLTELESMTFQSCKNLMNLPKTIWHLSRLKILDITGCEKLSSLPDNFGRLESLERLNVYGCSRLKRLCDDFGNLRSVVTINASGCPALEGSAMYKIAEVKSLMVLNIYESHMLINRWAEIKKSHPLLVCVDNTNGADYVDAVWRGFISRESRFVKANVDGELEEWPFSLPIGETKVVFLVTMSADISEEAPRIKEKLREVSSQGFNIIIYIYAGLEEVSQGSIRQALVELSRDTAAVPCAWTTGNNKYRQLVGYSLTKLIVGSRDLVNVRNIVGLAGLSVIEGGKKIGTKFVDVSTLDEGTTGFRTGDDDFNGLFYQFIQGYVQDGT